MLPTAIRVKSAPSRRGTSTYPEDSAPESIPDAPAAGPGYGASSEIGVPSDEVVMFRFLIAVLAY